jgi:NAD(P)-dependent dehydrogenase (short-subunit alcohol dehydrogenase family)
MPQEIIDAWLAAMPKGEFVRPEDIAEAVAFFASSAANFVTGQELTVDGGAALNTRSVTRTAAGAVR